MNDKISIVSGKGNSHWLVYGSAVFAILSAGIALLFTGASKYPELLGMGLLSFTLGLRHAFDADHISAIDNIIRTLVHSVLVIGMPVGFVRAAESKAELVSRDVPYITIEGTQGGSYSKRSAENRRGGAGLFSTN